MRWRIIPYAESEAAWNMSLDEAILETCILHDGPATLRFYGWSEPCVTVGRLQDVSTVPTGWKGPIIRRPTGGRAVRHGSDLTFSLACPAMVLGSPVVESYRAVAEAVAAALGSLGVPAEFCQSATPAATVRGIGNCFDLTLAYELSVRGEKVLGSAQVRRSGWVLQQNSLASVVGTEWPRRHALAEKITEAISQTLGVVMEQGTCTPEERRIAEHLFAAKYSGDDWNVRRIPPDSRMSP